MKRKKVLSIALLACAALARGQGQVQFNNRVTSGTLGLVVAPIFGPEPYFDFFLLKTGNTATGIPAGTQTYGGSGLLGTEWTAQLWGGPVGSPEGSLQLCANGTTTFRTSTGGAGFIVPTTAIVPEVPPGLHATFQVRVWYNRGGTITSWEQVVAADYAPHGVSAPFTPPLPLGGNLSYPPALYLPPALAGLESFNVVGSFPPIPEPATCALARKNHSGSNGEAGNASDGL